MSTVKLVIGDNREIVFNSPNSWNELNKKQLFYIAKHWQHWRQLAIENTDLIFAKLQLSLRLLRKNNGDDKILFSVLNNSPADDIYDVAQLATPFFNDNTLTICPLPVVSVWFKKYYAPANDLSNITAGEFAFADSNYLNYQKTNKTSDLDLLVATLYRPYNKSYNTTGELRTPFNPKLIERYAKKLKHLPEINKQLILLWYVGCRLQIIKTFQECFSKSNETKAKNTGWIPVIMELSGGKFGTFEQTAATDLHLVFMELQQLATKKNRY